MPTMDDVVTLRPVAEADLPELLRMLWDRTVTGEFQWFGFRVQTMKQLERRWHDDGLIGEQLSYLTVDVDGAVGGWVNWRRPDHVLAIEIGIALFPDFRGRGIGTQAQRLLVDHLFSTTPVHRLQAGTEVENVPEQRALEHAGFRREGVARGMYFREGQWRDSVMYGLLRDDSR